MASQEPEKNQLLAAWKIAIGLLAVEGIRPSDYLIEIAVKNMEGEVTINQAQVLLNNYYTLHPETGSEERQEEADLLSARIVKILLTKAVPFSLAEYLSLHQDLFSGLLPCAGKLRDTDLERAEWVVGGTKISYRSNPRSTEIAETLFSKEKNIDIRKQPEDKIIRHLALFISGLWRLHIFASGNTLAVAVFLIGYLHQLEYEVSAEVFARHAWYFRNALVRATFSDEKAGVEKTTEYLERFLRNLIFAEENFLDAEALYIGDLLKQERLSESEPLAADLKEIKNGLDQACMMQKTIKQDMESTEQDVDIAEQDIEWAEQDNETEKQDFEVSKQDIYFEKQDVRELKQDILEENQDIQPAKQNVILEEKQNLRTSKQDFTPKTRRHIQTLQETFSDGKIFGRSDVTRLLQITPSPASTLLQRLLAAGIIEPVAGHGKGKYRFP